MQGRRGDGAPRGHALHRLVVERRRELRYSVRMFGLDPDLEARHRTGRSMVALGIVSMVLSFVATVARGATGGAYGNSNLRAMEAAQSPWFLLPFFGGITLLVLGLVKKSNALREAQTRLEHDTMTTKLVPVADAPGGPFRGALLEVDVPDPILVEAEAAERLRHRARGGAYLIVGISILALTVLYMMSTMTGAGGSGRERVDHILTAFGLGVFPFGLGLFFTIKGGLLRSK